jgi:hypothetical protein
LNGKSVFFFERFDDVQVKDLPYETIANGHGPMLKFNMAELVEDYRSWSAKIGKSPACISVLYSDNYGYCDRLSQTLAHGITKADVATEMVDMVRAALRAQTLLLLSVLSFACCRTSAGCPLRRALKRSPVQHGVCAVATGFPCPVASHAAHPGLTA